ncbi:ribosome biogenesis factor YjgA [Desulfurivibrio dismutans]|uniref:ribosome biogenesis factor YjgA n=1 Tax=Desulfurivibrio dismutans TaxID=1398908 RepID=UPI0023DB6E69|nr:ribosome biogenesis factor YjgA [Desulfurivibrio alkaliphilus]MDF1614908.1 ribosome biogenesis factor YjgA [Desulfurivibrio alkaliphilus]
MQMDISRSEKKRQAARVEKMAGELAALSAGEIKNLPVAEPLRREILAAGKLNAGARKRQVKFIAKELRQNEEDYRQLGDFLARRKGSKLKDNEELHQVEQLRQGIITDAIAAFEEARQQEEPMPAHWPSPALDQARQLLPELDSQEIRGLAARYARSRKITHSREIFRHLKGLQERQKLLAAQEAAQGTARSDSPQD